MRRYKELKFEGKLYTEQYKIDDILIKKGFNWFLDCEIENVRIEIQYETLIFNSGVFFNGTWYYGVFRDGEWKNGTWENGVWYNGLWRNGDFNSGLIFNGKFFNGKIDSGTIRGGDFYKIKIHESVKREDKYKIEKDINNEPVDSQNLLEYNSSIDNFILNNSPMKKNNPFTNAKDRKIIDFFYNLLLKKYQNNNLDDITVELNGIYIENALTIDNNNIYLNIIIHKDRYIRYNLTVKDGQDEWEEEEDINEFFEIGSYTFKTNNSWKINKLIKMISSKINDNNDNYDEIDNKNNKNNFIKNMDDIKFETKLYRFNEMNENRFMDFFRKKKKDEPVKNIYQQFSDLDPFQEEDWSEKEINLKFYLSEEQPLVYKNGEPFQPPWVKRCFVMFEKKGLYYKIGEYRYGGDDFKMFYEDHNEIENNRFINYTGKIDEELNDIETNEIIQLLSKSYKFSNNINDDSKSYIDIISEFIENNNDNNE